MLILTFTRRAARELKDRLAAELGDPHAMDGAFCSTFHSVCFRILRQSGDALGYIADKLSIITPQESDALLEQVIRDLGLSKVSMKAARSALEARYTGRTEPGDLNLRSILDTYRRRLFDFNCLDFGSCLSEVNRLFREHPEILKAYRERIKFVFVDEVQDSDEVQFNLHDWFSPPAAFFAVGDRRQSIYNFRGARPDLMTSRHPDAEIIDLRENFRSGTAIVDAANAVIAHNGDTLARPMLGILARQGKVTTLDGRTDDILRFVRTLHDSHGFAWGDIAVLARSHRTLVTIEQRMAEARIPAYRVGKRFDVMETPEFRTLLAAAKLILNPTDNFAYFILSIGLGHTGIYSLVREQAARKHISHWEARRFDTTLPPRHNVEMMVASIDGPEEMATLDAKVAFTNIALELFRDGDQRNAVREAVRRAPVDTMEGLIEFFSMANRDAENEDAGGDVVTLLTAHAAKGLEWPAVIVCELNEGGFPNSHAVRGGDEAIREERRLFYVAATRAKEVLGLHARMTPDDFGAGREIKPVSRFIGEATCQSQPVVA